MRMTKLIVAVTFYSATTFCVAMLWIFHFDLSDQAPLSDDLSMIAFSREWSWDWVSKGLADYFIVYPEYYGPQSNFIRPISNFSYWIFGSIFGTDYPFLANKMQLLILTYGMLFTFSTLVGMLLLKVQNSRAVAALGWGASLLIPTFWTTPTPTYTSFVFDGLAITFCLIALYAAGQRRFYIMTICLALALMTKEISFPVILGFMFAFIITRNGRGFLGCGIAIAILAALRLNSFGLHAQGVYVFDSNDIAFSSFILDKIRNALTLPFGPVIFADIFQSEGINLCNRSGILLLINIGLYVMIGVVITRLSRRVSIRKLLHGTWVKDPPDARTIILLISTLAAANSFLFDAYVGANYRYAFNFLPFLFIALAGAEVTTFVRRMLFLGFLMASTIASGPSIAHLVKGSEFEIFRYQVVRALFEKIRNHQDSKSIVILNDFVLAYANPRAVEILAPTRSDIIRGTSLYLDNCAVSELSKIITQIERVGIETRITVILPECGRFAFESSPKLPEFVTGNTIRRNDQIHYEFTPDPKSNYLSVDGWNGRNLTIITRDTDLLYFDFTDRDWKYVANDALN